MADTTSIDDLPTDPSSGNQNNIMIQKMEMNNGMGGGMGNNQLQPPAQVYSPNVAGVNMMNGGGMGGGMGMQQPQSQYQNQNQNQNQSQNQNVMNELVTGLQRASASGLTNLPSRDIPMGTSNMMNDAQVKPNYIPQRQMQQNEEYEDYIDQHEEEAMNEEKYKSSVNTNDNMENIYKLIQVPLLVGILYFAFQLPIFRKYILKYLPSVFNSDGNYNISGLMFISSLFGVSYFGLTKILDGVSV